VLFAPLRDHLQRVVNRVMYGERDEPYRVLARLGQRLEATPTPDAVLPMVVETVAQALKLPYAAIVVQQDTVYMVAAEHGLPPGETTRLPLMYSNEVVGALILAPRGPGEVFTLAERRLLDDLARLVGVVTHAVHLTGELQRSRERLVMTREEERRRLRRDLHDGLGPQLAGFTLRIDAVRNLLRTDLAAAEALLCELSERTQASVADIRRLVYALRPPALDDLGLVAALHQHAAQYTSTGPQIDIVVPEQLPPLPAAVEVAAYRIAQEALTNVVRHSGASTCQIQLAVHDALCLQIWDTGRGIDADRRSGVGLTSIRERAAELGGNCSITARPSGGTIISVQLPLTVPAGTVDGHQQPSGMQAQREGQHDGSANTHSPR
jgi:signal transduction histidine kinase